jgi:hypothetical protein
MPRHVRFPRSETSGLIPNSVEPGSPAFNVTDQKVFVGGAAGQPVLVGFPVRDFRSTRTYRQEDVVYHDGVLWRARVAVIFPGPFDEGEWERLDGTGGQGGIELVGTVCLQPATLSDGGSSVQISAGSGIILDNTEPGKPRATSVSWPQRTLSKSSLPVGDVLYVGIDSSGAANVFSVDEVTPAWRRQNILVGHFIVSEGSGDLIDPVSRHFPSNTTRSDLVDFLETVGSFRIQGVNLQLSGANQLAISDGVIWSHHGQFEAGASNIHTIPAASSLEVVSTLRGEIVDVPAAPSIDPTIYDNAGVQIAVPDGQFTIQYIFLKPGGGAIACLGQQVYASLAVALASLPTDIAAFQFATTIAPEYVLLGAVVSNTDGSEQSVVRSRLGIAGSKIAGSAAAINTGEFLNRDGTLPMVGDLDLGGNQITNGVIQGTDVEIRPVVFSTTGDIGQAGAQLSINTTDGRVMIGDTIVSSRIAPHDEALKYIANDLVVLDDALYKCVAPENTPGAFDLADWQLIGSPPVGALTKEPDSAVTNQVDLTAGGGFAKALSINFNDGQVEDVVDFGGRAGLDRFGLPKGAFNADIGVRTQVGHGFTLVGTPIRMLLDGNWVLADAANRPTAVVREVIDANVFVIQYSGIIPNLPPALFAGNAAPVRNSTYYASSTPGILSSAVNQAPVLQALGLTSAILRLQASTGSILTLQDVYPIGAIYLTMDATLPAPFQVGMTWEQIAQGRALVGVGDNEESSYTAGEERGAEIPTGPRVFIGQSDPEATEVADGDIVVTYDPSDTVDDGSAPTTFEITGRSVQDVVQPGFGVFVFQRVA